MQRGRGGRRIDQCAEFALNAGSGLVIAIHVTISSDGTIMNQWNGMYHKVVNIRCLISICDHYLHCVVLPTQTNPSPFLRNTSHIVQSKTLLPFQKRLQCLTSRYDRDSPQMQLPFPPNMLDIVQPNPPIQMLHPALSISFSSPPLIGVHQDTGASITKQRIDKNTRRIRL